MFRIFSVDGSPLAGEICKELNCELGKFKIDKFSDGELSPQFLESIREKKVFLVSSTIDSEKILAMLLTIDAAKRASAAEIIMVIPYFGYSRQDRKEGLRGAIGAKLMADLFQTAGANRLICIDLHSEQIQGFFNIPVNLIPGRVVFSKYSQSLSPDDYCVVSPDAGGVKRAMKFYSKFLKRFPDTTFAMMSKIRRRPNEIERMDLIGEVEGRHVLLLDDMIDTGGTLLKAAKLLKDGGARRVSALISHGVLSGDGREKIANSKYLDKLVITDSISQTDTPKIKIISCVHSLAAAIEAVINKISMDERLDRL